jgi:MOSC domain-containing protein YiiM
MAATTGRDASGGLLRLAGVMVIVVLGGDVWPGDRVVVELPPLPHHRLEPV